MCLVQSIKHKMLCGKAAQTSCLKYTGEPRALPHRVQGSQKCVSQLRPPQAGGPHPSRCGLRRTAPPSPRGRLCAPHSAQGSREAAPITFVHACTYCFRAAFVYLSLSLLLPQSGNKIQLCSLAARRSRFGFAISRSRTAAACLSRCIRHWRRSKAKPLRGSRGRSRAVHRFAAGGAAPQFARICRGGFCITSNSLFRTQKSALAGAFVRIAYSSGKGTRAV